MISEPFLVQTAVSKTVVSIVIVPEARLFDLCNPGNNLGPIGQALGVPGGVFQGAGLKDKRR